MKKFLMLVAAAALVGMVISRARGPESDGTEERPTADGTVGGRTGEPLSAGSSSGGTAQPAASRAAVPQAETTRPRLTSIESAPPPPPRPPTFASQTVSEGGGASPTPTGRRPVETLAESDTLRRAEGLLEQGRRLEARALLSGLYRNGSPIARAKALRLLTDINKDLVFNPRCVVGAQVHVVQQGEVLVRIARKYKVSWRLIARLNGIDRPERIRLNQKLKILTGRREIFMDKSDFRLALFIDGHFIKEYRVGHGKDNCTPTGKFSVDSLEVEPDWYPPEGGVIKYGEKGHLIGDRWMGFADQPGITGIGIHGTDQPETIGTLCSNGCIRMLNSEVKELYDFITAGTAVQVVE